ncbi:unnamed protein product [Spirodela intermedia]|nr:unnamed protein product [Spirodela intermedia]CAA6667362.1 unnamed protein product [Spirodela intermedia]
MATAASHHALLLPYPTLGHVLPLMEIAHRLVATGFTVTFVNTEHNHRRLLPAAAAGLRLVALPDGLPPGDDREDIGRLTAAVVRIMARHFEELIRETNSGGDCAGEITYMVADQGLGWAFDIAKNAGIPAAAFWAASAATLSTILSIPKLVQDGIILPDGRGTEKETFQLAAGMPVMNQKHLSWNRFGNPAAQQVMFKLFVDNNAATDDGEVLLLCNSFPGIEAPTFSFLPRIIPLGPLLAGRPRFMPEDPGGAAWLDAHPPRSVIYVAFGSLTTFHRRQLEEIAQGLELSGRPFLWVQRSAGGGDDDPPELHRRRGKVLRWAAQQEVLAHPAVACFLTHCGWNSIVEGAANGVPFLCWPCFGDQFLNRDYICDVWRTGLSLPVPAEGEGVVSGEEIRQGVEKVMGDQG